MATPTMCGFVPVPARTWSRFENVWVQPGYVPPTAEETRLAQQLYKASVLQYAGNSSREPRWKRAAALARGQNRLGRTSFATQTASYTNPNTSSLWRVGATVVPFPPGSEPGVPTDECLPDGESGMRDGGVLVCGVYAAPCTNEPLNAGDGIVGVVGVQPDGTVLWPPPERAEAIAQLKWTPVSASDVPPDRAAGVDRLPWNSDLAAWLAPRQVNEGVVGVSASGGAAWNSGTANWKLKATSYTPVPS